MYKSENLIELRKKNLNHISTKPFEHQKDAFEKLTGLYNFKEHKSGVLVLPTGAGKTFTSENWICRNVLPKNIKVLWLAHTSHLLEQAFDEFRKNLLDIPPSKQIVNLRVVSSNPKHSNPSNINITDDVLIITSQTAISNFNTKAFDVSGQNLQTEFEKFLIHSKQTGLFVVLDEAHHSPAFGVRNLFIGGTKFENGIKQLIPNCNFLGLTATPTYTDARSRGFLWRVFENGIVYQAERTELEKQNILATPKYSELNTGEMVVLDERIYQQIVREHKDIPESIIENLAKNEHRNNFIVETYIKNKSSFGKTLIFADRWFQCEYIKTKLLKAGIKADAVYSKRDATLQTAEERNANTKTDNDIVLTKFKNNEIDVLLNVKMLTEGTDVPDVDTVFITRQTTSSILLTQMIGRALRGTQAQKKDEKGNPLKIKDTANIIFFTDNWRQVINFASVKVGGVEETEKVKGYYPVEYISIKLVQELSRRIDSGVILADVPFLSLLPLGWYETQINIAIDDEINTYKEFVVVSENTKSKFESFIEGILNSLPSEWEDENLSEDFMNNQAKIWIEKYFTKEDNISNTLDYELIKIARHIAQNQNTVPKFVYFTERNEHDLFSLANEIVKQKIGDLDIYDILLSKFNDSAKLWQSFYKSFDRFQSAFDAEKRRVVYIIKNGVEPKLTLSEPEIITQNREPSAEDKEKIFKHDNYTCQCCGIQINPQSLKERKLLVIDHISAYKFSGDSSQNNLQTLCYNCNSHKNINEMNFRITASKLNSPKELEVFDIDEKEKVEFVLRRIVNFFYNCKAVLSMKISSDGRNKNYKVWEIELYPENNPNWLRLYKDKLLDFIHNTLNCNFVEEIVIR